MLYAGLRLPTVQTQACSKCAYFKKSGKRSCCASGGAWFKDCGDADNPNVNHTWAEGMQACNEFADESSVEVAMQGMLRHETRIGGMLRVAEQWNVSPQHGTTGTSGGHFSITTTTQRTAYSTTMRQQSATRATVGGDLNANISQRNVAGMISRSRAAKRPTGDDSNADITQGDISSSRFYQQGTTSTTGGDFNAADAKSIASVKLEHVVAFCSVFSFV